MKSIITDKAPSSILYSQGIDTGHYVFTSGQIGWNNFYNKMEDKSFEEEVTQTLENLKAVIEAANLSFEDIAKVTIFITDIKEFYKFNKVYLKYFLTHKPARSCVEVSNLAKGARVEIEAIAVK